MNNNSNMLKLTFVGDLICQKEQLAALSNKGGDWDEIFSNVKGIFQGSDYVFGNLETPIAGPDLCYTQDSTVFNSPIEFAKAIKSLGVDFVSTANNHCLDRDIIGLTRTINALDKVGLAHTGTYADKSEANAIFTMKLKGVRIAVITATYGTNSDSGLPLLPKGEEWRVDLLKRQGICQRSFWGRLRHNIGLLVPSSIKTGVLAANAILSGKTIAEPLYITDNVSPCQREENHANEYLDRFLTKIKRAKKSSDLVIVLPHVGGQYNPGPGEYHKFIVRECANAGADIVISGHSHTPLRSEWLNNNCFAAYSLGNFCFTPKAGWYLNNVLADYGIMLNFFIDTSVKTIKRISFSVTKTVIGTDGISRSINVFDLLKIERDVQNVERIVLENEVVVNRIRGTALTVVPAKEYEIGVL